MNRGGPITLLLSLAVAPSLGIGAAARVANPAPQRPAAAAPAKTVPAAERAQKLPAPLRTQALAALRERDEAARAKLAEALIKADPAATLDFALAMLEEE